jgi:hypothetical protein
VRLFEGAEVVSTRTGADPLPLRIVTSGAIAFRGFPLKLGRRVRACTSWLCPPA